MIGAAILAVVTPGAFNLSNTLGDGMVLQRAPQAAVVWGFGTAGETISTSFKGATLKTAVGADGVWRQQLPPTEATGTEVAIAFSDASGNTIVLMALFGDVFLCSGG